MTGSPPRPTLWHRFQQDANWWAREIGQVLVRFIMTDEDAEYFADALFKFLERMAVLAVVLLAAQKTGFWYMKALYLLGAITLVQATMPQVMKLHARISFGNDPPPQDRVSRIIWWLAWVTLMLSLTTMLPTIVKGIADVTVDPPHSSWPLPAEIKHHAAAPVGTVLPAPKPAPNLPGN
jgi:hypothetical protein